MKKIILILEGAALNSRNTKSCPSQTLLPSDYLYFMLGKAEIRGNFSNLVRDASDIKRSPKVYMIKMSERSLGLLEIQMKLSSH